MCGCNINATYYKASTTACSVCATGKWSPAANTLTICNSCTNMGTGGYAYTSNACTYNCAQNYYGSSGTSCSACASETWTSAGNTSTSCSACTYNSWVLGNCLSSNYFKQTRTIASGNSAACTSTSQAFSYACMYCSSPGDFVLLFLILNKPQHLLIVMVVLILFVIMLFLDII